MRQVIRLLKLNLFAPFSTKLSFLILLQVSFIFSAAAEVTNVTIRLNATILEGTWSLGLIESSIPSDITIYLNSSDPSILPVPESVTLTTNKPWHYFEFTVTEDPRILPDRQVTITATFGPDVLSQTVTIKERSSKLPTIVGPTNVLEGATGIPFRLELNGIPTEPITIDLNVDRSFVSLQSSTLIIPVGETNALFFVSSEQDSLSQGNRRFTISASTAGSVRTNQFTLVDNEVTGFTSSLPERFEADLPQAVVFTAVNIDGTHVSSFSGPLRVYHNRLNNGSEELLQETTMLGGQATIDLQFSYADRGNLLELRSTDGLEHIRKLRIFKKMPIRASDLVYDPKRNLLYLVSDSWAQEPYKSSVTAVNPVSGDFDVRLFLGQDPLCADISNDQHYLYVGNESARTVARIDLDTFNLVAITDLKSAVPGEFVPKDLLCIGGPMDIIVTGYESRLFSNGILQPGGIANSSLLPSGTANEFFGIFGINSDLRRYLINSSGLVLKEILPLPAPFPLIDRWVAAESDLIFSRSGRLLNGSNGQLLGQLTGLPDGSLSAAIVPDLRRSRVFYTHDPSRFGSADVTIQAFDTVSLKLAAEASLLGTGRISKIVRWGEIGLAMLTEYSQMVLLEDDELVPSGPPTDVVVSITTQQRPLLSEDFIYNVGITNLSSNLTRNVRVLVDLNPGQAFKSMSPGAFTNFDGGNTIVISLGDLEPYSSQLCSITVTPNAMTNIACTVTAITDTHETNYANNKATFNDVVHFRSVPNSAYTLNFPINDLILEPLSGQLIASVPASAPSNVETSVVVIDPFTGAVRKKIKLPSEPYTLAVSSDGSTAFALNYDGSSAYRCDLLAGYHSGTTTFGTPTQPVYATDIKVLKGTRDSLIIASGLTGVRVYDLGVRRSLTTEANEGSIIALLPQQNLAFGYNNGLAASPSFTYQINANGVSKIVQTNLFTGPNQKFESNRDFVHSIDGTAVHAATMTIAGRFDLSVLPGTNAVAVESDLFCRRVYFAREKQIASFDSESYLHIRTIPFDVPARFTALERWGNDGFAARLSDGKLVIIRSDIVSQGTNSIDLLVSTPDNFQVTRPLISISGQAFTGHGIASVTVGTNSATTLDSFAHWDCSIESLVEGPNVLTITAISAGVPPSTRTITRTVHYLPDLATSGSIADQWLIDHFGSLNSPEGAATNDPDTDGQSNLSEFLFGTDPLNSDKPHFEIIRTATETRLEMIRRNSTRFEFTIESSMDLTTWTPLESNSQESTASASEPNCVRVSLHLDSSEELGGRFYRVKVLEK